MRRQMHAIQELCEKRDNHADIIGANALPVLYHHCATAADSRIRNYAIWTLNHLAADETNRMIMMQGGGLGVHHLPAIFPHFILLQLHVSAVACFSPVARFLQ